MKRTSLNINFSKTDYYMLVKRLLIWCYNSSMSSSYLLYSKTNYEKDINKGLIERYIYYNQNV